MAPDNQDTARKGRCCVKKELWERGVRVEEMRQGNLVLLAMSSPVDGRPIKLRVKTRTAGSWQGSIRDADETGRLSDPDTYWVFVKLEIQGRPGFFIVPDPWMRRDIHDAHQNYLENHGGIRPDTPDSTHHAIKPGRISQWRDRWDLLGL